MTTAALSSFNACVEPSVLAAWCSGRLDARGRAAVEHHMDGCSECGELMAAAGRVCASATHSDVELTPTELLGEDLFAISALLDAQLGPYRLQTVVGGGGLGLVFEAHDERLDRRVAIKALRRTTDQRGVIRREAQALAALSHPAVVDVFDVLERNGREYLVMEFVAGETLRTWQAGRSASEVIGVYRTVAQGLAAVHEAGIVHCDVKPDNVLVADDGRVLVADFGLALLADARGLAGRAPGGTPRYMSPEHRAGESVSFASDQYAFAVCLWEALTTEVPRLSAESIPAGLRVTLERALSPRAEDRWPSMTSLEGAMQPKTSRRWPAMLAGLSLATGLGVAALVLPGATPTPSRMDPLQVAVAAGDHATVAAALAEAEMQRGRGDLLSAQRVLVEASADPTLPATSRLTLDLRRAKLLDFSGQRQEAGSLLETLERDSADAPDRLRAEIALEIGRTRPLSAPSDTSEDWLRTARARLLRAGVDPSFDLEARRVAASVYQQHGDREAASKELDAALDLVGAGTSAFVHAEVLRERGDMFSRLGRYDDAEKALDAASAVLADHDLQRTDVGMSVLATRGNLQWFQGHKSRALRTLQDAVTLSDALEGASPLELAQALNDLGSYAMEQGQFERAEAALLRAAGIVPEFYAVTANLAIYYGRVPCNDAPDPKACAASNQERAYEYQFRAYETAREQLPPGHPSLAQMAGNLAYDYTQQGRYVLALQHYEEALDGLTAAYGEDHIKLMRPLLGALEVAVRTDNADSARRLAVQTRSTADANRSTLGPAAMSVVEYALVRTNAWTSDSEPADPDELEAALAFFEGQPPQDVGMIDSWFGEAAPEPS